MESKDSQSPVHGDDQCDVIGGQAHRGQHDHHGDEAGLRDPGGADAGGRGGDAGNTDKHIVVLVDKYIVVLVDKYIVVLVDKYIVVLVGGLLYYIKMEMGYDLFLKL